MLIGWYFIFLAGTFQFKAIKRNTGRIIMEYIASRAPALKEPLPEQVHRETYQQWSAMVRQKAWFVLDKRELIPIPATIKNVEARLGYSPVWVANFLAKEKNIKKGKS